MSLNPITDSSNLEQGRRFVSYPNLNSEHFHERRYHNCDIGTEASIDFQQGRIDTTINGERVTIQLDQKIEHVRSIYVYVSDADASVSINDQAAIADHVLIYEFEHLDCQRMRIKFPSNGSIPAVGSFAIMASDSPWAVYKNSNTIVHDVTGTSGTLPINTVREVFRRHYAGYDQMHISVENDTTDQELRIEVWESSTGANWLPIRENILIPANEDYILQIKFKYHFIRINAFSTTGTVNYKIIALGQR